MRLASFGAIGEIIAKAIKGKLVIIPALQLANPISYRIVPSKGPTEVIAGLKLNPAIIIAIIKRTRLLLFFYSDLFKYTDCLSLLNFPPIICTLFIVFLLESLVSINDKYPEVYIET